MIKAGTLGASTSSPGRGSIRLTTIAGGRSTGSRTAGWTARTTGRWSAPGGSPAIAVIRQRERPVAGVDAKLLFLFTSDTEFGLNRMRGPRFSPWCRGADLGPLPRLGRPGSESRWSCSKRTDSREPSSSTCSPSTGPARTDCCSRCSTRSSGAGHDVQLHVHPNPHLRFAPTSGSGGWRMRPQDDTRRFPRGDWSWRSGCSSGGPGGFRSPTAPGAYRIFDSHFPILRELGISIDSSINPFKNCNVAPWLRTRTQPFRVDGVLEIPISLRLLHARHVARAPVRTANRASASVARARGLRRGRIGRPATVCCIAHSVSFLRRGRPAGPDAKRAWNERWASS